MSGAPVGEAITVKVDGKERTLHVKPNVFSDATLSALARIHKQWSREGRKQALKDLSEMRPEIDEETFESMQRELIQSWVAPDFGGYLDAVNLLRTRRGMAVALAMNCDEVGTEQEADKIIGSCDSVIELFAALFNSGNEALEAAKNSSRPRGKEAKG